MTGPLRRCRWRESAQEERAGKKRENIHLSLRIKPTADLEGLRSLNEAVYPGLTIADGDHCKGVE